MRKRKNSRFIIFLIVLLCFTLSIGFCLYKMHPIIIRYAESSAETIMLDCANKAIVSILEKYNVSYDDIVKLSNNSQGYVTSLEIDVYEVNRLKSYISNETSKLVASRENYDVSIPIGTFFGSTYTSGLGPRLKLKMQMTSTAFVNFRNEFKSAGINQVLHIIYVDMDIKGSLIIAGYNKSISASTSAIAAQTVIVGNTPSAYTNVIESENDNTAGLINDYGAIAE